MNFLQRKFGYILLFVILLLFGMNDRIYAEQLDRQVELDLSYQHDSSSVEFYNALDGEWVFFDQVLLTPEEVVARIGNGIGDVISLPSSFKEQTGRINSFGTYSINIKIPSEYVGETLAIHIPYQYSAYKLFVDQKEIAENGVVGEEATSHKAEMAPRTGYFIAESDNLLLTMQISSFNHIRGGFENSIYIGDASVVSKKFNTNMIGTLFMNGSIFIIGLFMILFAWYRKQEQLFLIFGLFAMFISARALFAVPFYYTMLFFDISWLWGTRLEYILTEATALFYVILLWKWYERKFSKKVMYGLVSILLVLIVTTLFTQPVFFQTLFFNVFYLTIPLFFYVIYITYKSIRNDNEHAIINLIGMGIIFLAFFNDFAIGQGWYKSWNLMLPAVAVYIVIHVVSMSRNFADSVKKTELQNEELRALNVANEKLATQLRDEMKRKDDFLANTSHELRNPLHGIMGITQSILRHRSENLDEKVKNDLALQLTISQHMSQTVEDLLDVTRLREERIQLQKESVNLQAIALGVTDMLRVLIENKDIQMEVLISTDFPHVAADRNRLTQVLFNLLHNAIKYTHEGKITIHADVYDEQAHIHITDTGVGMSEETLKKAFELYEQDDSSMTAISGGLGLGLSICKQLVELHGGTIEAHSLLGEGSTFTFTMPLADETSEKNNDLNNLDLTKEKELSIEVPTVTHKLLGQLTENVSQIYKPKILVVDDDPVNLQILIQNLSENDYEFKGVTSGREALEQINLEEWDLVITDVMMPEMSGYELTQSIRKRYSISELPILLLTARTNVEDIYTGFLVGANDYVMKPVEAMELHVRVQTLTQLQSSIKERLWMEAAWLHAQMRPHFLLNALNGIMSLSETDLPRMTRLLEKLSHYLQRSFYFKNLEEFIPLQDELDLIKSYLYIEKERFGERLQIEWDLDETDNVLIPPLSIQTLVENAVNHGVLKKIEGGTVKIKVCRHNHHVNISVIDNGVGMDEEQLNEIFTVQPSHHKGIGLINTEQRLRQLFGQGLQITSVLGEGTQVKFAVPFHRNEQEEVMM